MIKYAIAIGVVVFLFLGVYLATHQSPKTIGSVVQGQEYYATTTAPSSLFGAQISAGRMLKGGYGSLGSVVITGANTGIINFYDATTSDVNLRLGQRASSTILLASLPASLVAGTYTFDVSYGQGLFMTVDGGTVPTTTVTYR